LTVDSFRASVFPLVFSSKAVATRWWKICRFELLPNAEVMWLDVGS
jgi:hypothetical protein